MKLTIKNYKKIEGMYIVGGWEVEVVEEFRHKYYIHIISKEGNSETVSLGRFSEYLLSNESVYPLLWNGKKTNTSFSSDWISDKDNMIKALGSVIHQMIRII